jgi:CheY-like chemotaxis protein
VSTTHHPRVLVVEDDEDCAMLLEEILTERGFAVEVAHDGGTALELAERTKPDVGVLDVGLPDMDGFELARRLRKLGENGRTMRLIALSGYGSEDDIDEARAAGFDLHLTKPVLPGTLADALASCQPAREGPQGADPS